MLKEFFRKNGWRYIPGAVFLVLCAFIQTRAPLALGKAVDLAVKGDWNAFFPAALMILWIALATFITRYIWRWFLIVTSREMEVWMRDELYTHLLNLPMGFFGKVRSGDMMSYAINDVNAVRMMFGVVVAQVLSAISQLMFSVGQMSAGINLKLSLFALIPVPIALAVVIGLGNVIRARAKYAQEMFQKISGHVQENVNGMRVIKAFAQEKPQYEEYEAESMEKYMANKRLYYATSLMDPLVSVLFGISFAVGIIYGGTMVLDHRLSLADYIAFNSYLEIITGPIRMIGRMNNNLQRGLASYKRLSTLMSEEETPAFDRADDGKPVGASIEARNLTFSYAQGGREVLSDISFDLKPGKVLGIVGPTGGGKTTVLSLITKLVTPEKGQLFIGGRDVTEIPAVALRAKCGYVPQDGFLFDESILENVSFFSGADEEKVRRYLDIAGMTGDIQRMPDGLETKCGERGNHLSGGQRQRVSLARALIREPDILLLDDTLSAVDAATEEKILENLKSTLESRTCVIVAHRLSAVRHADEIIYISDDGRITERGTHETLLAKDGAYAALYREQHKEG